VVFTGFIDEVEKVMQAVDVFVLPSHREGMPRTVIEAMACGKPVVATNIRGCREEIVHGETGYLVPLRNAGALSDAITSVLANPQKAAEMGLKGRKRAELHFDEVKVLDRQLKHYSRIIQERLPAMASTVVPKWPDTGSTGSHGFSSSGCRAATEA
jgi:glycosyltransferase involved in cell wall biosynthesis